MDFDKDFNPDEFFRKVIENIKPMNSVQAHYLMNSLYAIEFKLFDHLDREKSRANPFAVIRAHPEEDSMVNSLLEDALTRYRRNKIESRLGLNFLEYIKLPMPVSRKLDDLVYTIVAPIEKEEQNAQTAAFNNLSSDK